MAVRSVMPQHKNRDNGQKMGDTTTRSVLRGSASARSSVLLLFSISIVLIGLDLTTVNLNAFLPDVAFGSATSYYAVNNTNISSSTSAAISVLDRNAQQLEVAQTMQKVQETTDTDANGGRDGGCWRHCPQGYPNKIVSTDIKSSRGLADRGLALFTLANLGGYLCATVEFPRPIITLHPAHNHGRKVHRDSVWSDYFNITYYPSSNSAEQNYSGLNSFHAVSELDYQYHKKFRRSSSDYKYYRTSSLDQLLQDFESVETFSWNSNQSFLWEIETEWYQTKRKLLKVLRSRVYDVNNSTLDNTNTSDIVGSSFIRRVEQRSQMLPALKNQRTEIKESGLRFCDYAKITVPRPMQQLANLIWDDIKYQKSTSPDSMVGMLHIRRTDSVNSCNTSLPRMESYLNCTFLQSSSSSSTPQNKTLLFATDDFDPTYRRGFEDLIHKYLKNVTFVDADFLIENHTKQAISDGRIPSRNMNNFYIFKLGNVVANNASFNLRQHREDCPDCDTI